MYIVSWIQNKISN